MNIKILDASGSPEARRDASIDRRFQSTFYNTGNILIHQALREQIPQARPVSGWQDLQYDTDIAVIAMANFFNPYTDVTAEAAALRTSSASRIVLVSCGAQAANYDDQFELRPDTREFLSIVSERSRSIGVRGAFTAELLYRNGFKNLRVIGCPSLYLSGTEPPKIRLTQHPRKIAIGVTPIGDLRSHIQDLYAFGMRTDATYILQSEQHLLGLFTDQPSKVHQEKLDFFENYYCPAGVPQAHFANWLRDRATLFFDVEPWIEARRVPQLLRHRQRNGFDRPERECSRSTARGHME
jgi:hypothetical protein